MISFNVNDTNMKDIAARAKLFNCVTRYGYRVFGLKQERKSVIHVRCAHHLIQLHPHMQLLRGLFGNNNIPVKIEHVEDLRDEIIRIGLRLDIRQSPEFAARCLKTIVFSFEEVVIPDTSYYFPNTPNNLKNPDVLW